MTFVAMSSPRTSAARACGSAEAWLKAVSLANSLATVSLKLIVLPFAFWMGSSSFILACRPTLLGALGPDLKMSAFVETGTPFSPSTRTLSCPALVGRMKVMSSLFPVAFRSFSALSYSSLVLSMTIRGSFSSMAALKAP